ncbi:hypothetical protein AB0O91_09400 [Kitasatospora sp. NPDC089797]|uniref:hypothetical protein n=1 Tax=Kitasatospora sp. NPDC089797 TaxID=3155298 RepID=UPI00344951C7
MFTRFLFTVIGNRRFLHWSIRCWVALVDGLAKPWVRVVAGGCAALAGALAVVRFLWFRHTADETLQILSESRAVASDPHRVMQIGELMNALWLASGVALIGLGLLVAVAGSASVVLVVGGILWWTPLAMVGQQMPSAAGLHTIGAAFIAASLATTVLTPVQSAARGSVRRRTNASGHDDGDVRVRRFDAG